MAIVGAGSIGFTQTLIRDCLLVPELQDSVFALHDISDHNLQLIARLIERDITAAGLPARIEATTDRAAAIRAADFVLCTARVGGLDAFALDVEIPLKYGVDQCVGDTLCAGGLM